MKITIQKHTICIIIFSVLTLLSACSVSESATERDTRPADYEAPGFDEEISEEFIRDELDGFERTLFDYRSSLEDQFSSIEQEIPEEFLHDAASQNPAEEYAGYRVQILSTREVAVADSTLDDFRVWAARHVDDYHIEAYIYFRQPYYRVRAGDFKDREKAIEFARIAKQQYPDAWIVHDRINPENIPD